MARSVLMSPFLMAEWMLVDGSGRWRQDGPHTRALHSRCHMEKHRSCSCITGYHVLLYDLHGRGYSDAPQVTYDVSLYTTHLALLI